MRLIFVWASNSTSKGTVFSAKEIRKGVINRSSTQPMKGSTSGTMSIGLNKYTRASPVINRVEVGVLLSRLARYSNGRLVLNRRNLALVLIKEVFIHVKALEEGNSSR